MKKGFFTNLPLEITIDILSRLPLRTIFSCKFVCKSWLELLDSLEFAKSHLSKSAPGLVTCWSLLMYTSYEYLEFEDGEDLECHNLHYYPFIKFDFPHRAKLKGSANGLLFLCKYGGNDEAHYVCNPVTHDYIEVHCPKDSVVPYLLSVTYGFGASKITGQYKVVRISHGSVFAPDFQAPNSIIHVVCDVYTLGTGSWRRIEHGAQFVYSVRNSCVFLNGNLHWIVSDSDSKWWISCFNIETERFSTFPVPPVYQESSKLIAGLCALGDCLCLCDISLEDETAVIWLMKEYGVEKSWTNEYVINIHQDDICIESDDPVRPIKVFKDGGVLMLWEDFGLFYYSSKTQTSSQEFDFCANTDSVNSVLFTPTFLSLKSLGVENAISF